MRTENKLALIVVVEDGLTDDQLDALGTAISVLPGVLRVMGPAMGMIEYCECDQCGTGKKATVQ